MIKVTVRGNRGEYSDTLMRSFDNGHADMAWSLFLKVVNSHSYDYNFETGEYEGEVTSIRFEVDGSLLFKCYFEHGRISLISCGNGDVSF